jgi:hypothetical protein
MGKLFTLIFVAALGYGGLYFYYGVTLKRAVEQHLDGMGMSALEVNAVDFHALDPLRQDTQVSADIEYGGGNATVQLRVIGHPVFSEELRLELDSLQALRLRIGN